MRFEIAGGVELQDSYRRWRAGSRRALMAFGRADEAVGQTSAFATSMREATREMLVELGCAVGPWSDMVADRATRTERPRSAFPGRARVISDEPANEDEAAGAAAAAAPVDAGRRRAVKRRTKRAVMDRVGYDEVARISAYMRHLPARNCVLRWRRRSMLRSRPISRRPSARPSHEILDDVVGLGPLQPLIEDDTVTEIMINGCRSAFFERGGVLYPIEHAFEDDEQIRVIIDRIISPLGRRVDGAAPSSTPASKRAIASTR